MNILIFLFNLIGLSYENACSSGVILSTLVPLLCILIMVIIILLFKAQKTKSISKKQKDSLWVENTPLKAMTETGNNDGA